MTDDDLRTIDLNEATRLTGIPLSTLYKLIDRGEIPALNTGRRIRIRLSSLRTWLDDQEARACQAGEAPLPFERPTGAGRPRSR